MRHARSLKVRKNLFSIDKHILAYEFYLNDPQSTPEAELQTQVVFPLE